MVDCKERVKWKYMKDVVEVKSPRLYGWLDVKGEDRKKSEMLLKFCALGNWMVEGFNGDIGPRTRSSLGGAWGKGERRW